MPTTRLSSSELVQVAYSSHEEMVALDVCICDKWSYGGLGEQKAQALYLKESHHFGIVAHAYGHTHWLTGRSLEASIQFFVASPWMLRYPDASAI